MKSEASLKSRLQNGKGRPGGDRVFSREEFQALVKYERARSDRNGSIFSITVFDSDALDKDCRNNVITKATEFSRSIDCVGFCDTSRIAVLLPDTARHGADTFGRKVLDELAKIDKKAIRFDIYSYPENLIFSNDDEGRSSDGKHGSGGADSKGYDSIKESIDFLFVGKIPVWKRSLDVVGASLILLVLSPVFLALAMYIKLVSPGPVFFKQTRVGYKGIPFEFYKFRTMKVDNDQGFHGAYAQNFIKGGDIPMEKLDKRDPRIILGGKVLRKSCLDELPQLWNVLKGNMSLVGPRPCIPYEAKEYLRWHTNRFDVLPGMSGLWQVSGKNKLTFKQMVRLDISYCRNISFWRDIAIILKTPYAIMKMVFESVSERLDRKNEEILSLPMLETPKKAVR